nr:hypothetical protein [Acutalibacter sp. M00118]
MTSRIVGIPMNLQICGVLVELPAVHAANGIYHQVIVKVTSTKMRSHYNFKIGEFPFCKLETNDVSLLRGKAIVVGKGLHEVVELSPICFPKLPFRCKHFCVSVLGSTIVP